MRHCVFLMSVLAWVAATGQSKKEIIAAQGSALDSISRIAEQQHEAILKATVHIEQLSAKLKTCGTALRDTQDRVDSLRRASSLAYAALKRERDSL